MIEIKRVSNKKDLKRFIELPHQIYKDDPNYVPELYISQKDLLDKNKHPFHKHSKAEHFIALSEKNIPLGRIAAIRNNNYIDSSGENVGFFGFFEAVDDYEVSKKLLDTANNWLKKEGLNTMFGPTNYSTNETCGTLIEGFDSPPVVLMTYNKKYYLDHFEQYGLKKKIDLFAWKLTKDNVSYKVLEKAEALENRLKRKDIHIRKMKINDMDNEVERIKKIYNSAWEENWGFVHMTDEEFDNMAKELKFILDENIAFIAEHKGEPVGFSLGLPDINQALIKISKGRLLPFGWLKLLYYKKKINRIRIVTLGVLKEYRKMGIEGIFYAKKINEGLKKGYTEGEASWILENNQMMNKGIENLSAELYKKYRIYQKDIE